MDKKCLLATLAGTVVFFLGGWIIYELVLGGFLAANMDASVISESPNFLWIVVGQLAAGAALATILSWKGASSPAEGAKAGALIGCLLSAMFGFMLLGTWTVSTMPAVLVDIVAAGVLWAAAGAAIGLVMGRAST